ncbi:hypothetical protein JMN32_19720 [Fulvivirga sp. 29W222]|uniref:Uncharacterized protein n=1 Tax=Fulvivirga marina TaxID=2494733 RepID=A0A937KDK1_9BACT|nr:hypothetical protein [Fulvivirga marina]MBL6448549.1 hypothetical protein [Fulvivirga marina]
MNQADKVRQLHNINRAKVSMLTGLSVEELFTMTFESAYSYLKNVMQVDDYGMQHLPQTSEFWAWWRMEWNRVDMIFMSKIRKDLGVGLCAIEDPRYGNLWAMYSKGDLANYYRLYHLVSHDNVHINSAVMSASAHRLIKYL